MRPWASGLDVARGRPDLLRGRRYGLLTGGGAADRRLEPVVRVLTQVVGRKPEILFAPEHGFLGAQPAGQSVTDRAGSGVSPPLVSLYGARIAPEPAHLAAIDCLVVDLPDVGVRYFTYLATLLATLRACAGHVAVVILDRGNPQGRRIDGPLMADELASPVGVAGLPVLHGMTLGELARWCVGRERIDVDLTVIAAPRWRGEPLGGDRPWISPSPNLGTRSAARLYAGTCLFEAVAASEGRGTARPFEQFGAPGIDGTAIVEAAGSLPGVLLQAVAFQPAASKHQGVACAGCCIHIVRPDRLRPLRVGLELLRAARRCFPEAFAWLPPRPPSPLWIDRLLGHPPTREAIDHGGAFPFDDLWGDDLRAFEESRAEYLLYR